VSGAGDRPEHRPDPEDENRCACGGTEVHYGPGVLSDAEGPGCLRAGTTYAAGYLATCQHCGHEVEFGQTEHGYRGFVHAETGTTECPQPAD
jgi:hypothetical protein